MTYTCRNQIRNGDLICFEGGWFLSRRIRKGQWLARLLHLSSHKYNFENFSHVGIAIWLQAGWETEPRLFVAEAVGNGARLTSLSELVSLYTNVGGKVCWKPHDPKKINGNQIAGNALNMIGKPYAGKRWLQYLYAFLGIRRDIEKNGHTCSGYVAAAVKQAGHPEIPVADSLKPCDVICLPVWLDVLTKLEVIDGRL